MTMVKSMVGAAMFGYAVLYILQVVFSTLLCRLTLAVRSLACDELHHRGGHLRRGGSSLRAQAAPEARHTSRAASIGALAAFYTTLALGIWFFTVWFRLLTVGRRRVRQRVRQRDLVPGVRAHPLCSRNNRGFTLEVGPP